MMVLTILRDGRLPVDRLLAMGINGFLDDLTRIDLARYNVAQMLHV